MATRYFSSRTNLASWILGSMPTAEPLPDNIRRIAVLVASVDSATARQLLLHLPTSVAKQVRRALQNLGSISSAERQRILAEFHSTAARQKHVAVTGHAVQPTEALTAAPSMTAASLHGEPFSQATRQNASLAEQSERRPFQTNSNLNADSDYIEPPQGNAQNDSPLSWKQMDMRALSRFLRGERSTVIAVVINQLPPDIGVALLQHLPPAMHREILLAIANLQDFDAEALQAIEEHLAERLRNYELQVNSETKGTRRIAALLAAAPPELQDTWARFVHIAVDPAQQTTEPIQIAPKTRAVEPLGLTANASNLSGLPTSSNRSQYLETELASHVVTTSDVRVTPISPNDETIFDEGPRIIPFPEKATVPQLSATDRSLIQIEFEQILALSTDQLAQVLTTADSQTVLLALAGASPSFMKRFYSMLSKSDVKALSSRLSQIGPLKLRDIDDAQRTIAELAAKLTAPRTLQSSIKKSQSLRVAA